MDKSSSKNAKNGPIWRVFENLNNACGQTELPDRSVLIGQKLVENAAIEKFKCDILGDFQTLCTSNDRHIWTFMADFKMSDDDVEKQDLLSRIDNFGANIEIRFEINCSDN